MTLEQDAPLAADRADHGAHADTGHDIADGADDDAGEGGDACTVDSPFEAPLTDPVDGPCADPTDAPDVGGSLLVRLGGWRLFLAGLQGAVATAIVVAIIVAPGDVGSLIGRLSGVAIVVVAVSTASGEIRRDDSSSVRLALLVGAVVAAGFLIIDPDRWLTPIGRIVGTLAALLGVFLAGAALRASDAERWKLARSAIVGVAAGGLLFRFGATMFETLALVALLVWVATSAVRVGAQTGFVDIDLHDGSRRALLMRWLDLKGKTQERRDDIYDQVFFEGPTAPARITRFMLMMLFASVISAAGVVSDSTAVVIGAMLVAPLISPMMGMGLSLATGWPNRLGRSALIVFGGTAIAIGTGWLLAATALGADLLSNSQITSRSSPRLVDLIIAIAAGAAGSFAISRKDASASLPGVAVAIALVPPLSVVGITAEGGDWEQASGTLLLFMTNLVAIILAGGTVFVLTGVVPLRRFAENQHRVRTAFVSVGVLALLVIAGLTINGRQIAEDSLATDQAGSVVADWLGDESSFEVASIEVDDRDVAVVLTGPGDPPDPDRLADDLGDALGGDIRLDLQWIPRQRVVVSPGG